MYTILEQKVKVAEPVIEESEHKHRHHLKSGEKTAPTSNCPRCQAHSANKLVMSEDELTELRITYVKNQILKKLKLTERPDVSLSGIPLPLPVAEGATMQLEEEDANALTGIPDDFYAKTNQKIIFPQMGKFILI